MLDGRVDVEHNGVGSVEICMLNVGADLYHGIPLYSGDFHCQHVYLTKPMGNVIVAFVLCIDVLPSTAKHVLYRQGLGEIVALIWSRFHEIPLPERTKSK